MLEEGISAPVGTCAHSAAFEPLAGRQNGVSLEPFEEATVSLDASKANAHPAATMLASMTEQLEPLKTKAVTLPDALGVASGSRKPPSSVDRMRCVARPA